jgi:hypothetical protein
MEGRAVSHYRIDSKVGGMGVVYPAEDTRLRRPVVLTRDEEARQRFEQEVEADDARHLRDEPRRQHRAFR